MARNSCRLISGTTQTFVYRHCRNPEKFSSGSWLSGPKTGTQDFLNMKDCHSFNIYSLWLNLMVKITRNPLRDSPPLNWFKTKWPQITFWMLWRTTETSICISAAIRPWWSNVQDTLITKTRVIPAFHCHGGIWNEWMCSSTHS